MKPINRGHVVWLTGLSGAGKSTLAGLLEKQLIDDGLPIVCLDGDDIRRGLSSDLGFSRDDRKENIRRIAEVARLLADAGIVVVVSAISPYESDRVDASDVIGAQRLSVVHVSCPLEVCVQRDVKALYRRALTGDVAQFTGISSPYEVPNLPALTLQTDAVGKEECLRVLVEHVRLRVGRQPDAGA